MCEIELLFESLFSHQSFVNYWE